MEKELKNNPKASTAFGEDLHKAVIKLLENEKKGRLLDAPAGEGALCKELKNKGFDVYACDIDPSQFKLKDIECMKVDLNKPLQYQSSSFDYITCVEGLEHIENPWNVIREFSRVIKKGGKLIITTPNISSLYSRALFLTRGNFYLFNKSAFSEGHINPMYFPELELILNKNNFKIDKITNEEEIVKKRIGQRFLYYSLSFFEKMLDLYLYSIEYFIYKFSNTLFKRNKKLSSIDKNDFIHNKKIAEGFMLIIKATKR